MVVPAAKGLLTVVRRLVSVMAVLTEVLGAVPRDLLMAAPTRTRPTVARTVAPTVGPAGAPEVGEYGAGGRAAAGRAPGSPALCSG